MFSGVWRLLDVSRETLVVFCWRWVFHVEHGWGCMCGLLELRKCIWVYMEVGLRLLHSWPSVTGDDLVVSRETQGGVVVSFLLAVWDWVGFLMECFTWNVGVYLGWFVGIGCCGFEGVGSRCLSGWMSGLVVFGVGWCFTWNVGLMGAQCGVVSRGTSLLSIFMAGYDNGWWVGWVVCCGDSFLFGLVLSALQVI